MCKAQQLLGFVVVTSLVWFSWSLTLPDGTAWTTRRKAIADVATSTTAAAFLLVNNRPAQANDEDSVAAPLSQAQPLSLTVPKGQAVLVLGANGQTGRECVRAALAQGRPCIATTRSGGFDFASQLTFPEGLLTTAAADVSSLESLQAVVAASSSSSRPIGAVIFAASASAGKTRDVVFGVDKDGVINAAQCCIANKIPRLVIVSSGSVTRPDSAVYKLLNFVGSGIMEAKIQGEDAVRALYASPEVLRAGLGYTIVRPGGLTTLEAPLGAAAMELNQGDNKSGRLSRADVAELCVRALDSAETFDTTFECYEKVTAKPIESVGFSNIMKSTDPTAFKSGKERQGDTYPVLFQGLERDSGHML